MLKILKTQDYAYISLKNSEEKAKIEKLKSNLHVMQADPEQERKKHIIFVDTDKESDFF